jgi:SAM-dependent methyltransferase
MKICLACGTRLETSWHCPACQYAPQELQGRLIFAPELAETANGFRPHIFAELADLEARNFWFRNRNRLIIWAIKRYFASAQNLLEIGCGTGFVLSGIERALPQLSLFGSEVYSAGLAVAAQRLQSATFFQMDARRIPFEKEFDVIGAFDVLEHIEEDEAVLDQMHQAVSPDGGIILTVPQHAFLWSRADEYACHIRRYKARDLKNKVTKAGFAIERVTSFVSCLLPAAMLSRFIQQKQKTEYDPMAELKISGVPNVILEGSLAIEQVFIRLGLNLPFGVSLMVIARRV